MNLNLGSEKKKFSFSGIIIAIILFAAVVGLVCGNVNVSTDSSSSNIETLVISDSFRFADVESIELKEDLKFEKDGFNIPSVYTYAGKFKNDKLGKVDLFAYKLINKYIVVTLKTGHIIVVNQENEESTIKLYEQYLSLLETFKDVH